MDLRNKIDELDMKAKTSYLSTVEVESQTTLVKSLADIEYGKVKYLKQKAKTRWALEGDENTSFFHGIINKRRNISRITGLNVQEEWVSDAMSIKNHVFHFFKIKDTVWDCRSDKAPGPDGFTFKFIKKHWDLFENDIIAYVKDFETSSYIPRRCNSSFITLVPKLEDPLVVGDFRPISLIGCHNKIIAKVLSNRLSKVISSIAGEIAWDKVISPRQKRGLGIGILLASNQSMLSKWLWRFHTEENALWCKVHGLIFATLKMIFVTWESNYQGFSRKKAGNGRNTSYWHYNWIGGATLQDSFGDYIVLKQRRAVWVPTRVNLDKRGIDLDSVRCPLCNDDIETKDHVFALCSIAKEV
ncbi:RNA-directed DNA polymerase, eukaryota [Tanacetum coccineum]|uniref:RNA-directed DNA polymerase, eukaryota n=1 Tax=Tanacetum coccineum TaxID=301880 RepID=A0ABQ4Z8A9_9ASTR